MLYVIYNVFIWDLTKKVVTMLLFSLAVLFLLIDVCLCQVAHCYPDIVADLPCDLVTLLHHQGPLLDADMRMASAFIMIVQLIACM